TRSGGRNPDDGLPPLLVYRNRPRPPFWQGWLCFAPPLMAPHRFRPTAIMTELALFRGIGGSPVPSRRHFGRVGFVSSLFLTGMASGRQVRDSQQIHPSIIASKKIRHTRPIACLSNCMDDNAVSNPSARSLSAELPRNRIP